MLKIKIATSVDPDELLGVHDTALKTGKSRWTIYRWIKKGTLTPVWIGGRLYIHKAEIERVD